MIGVIIYGTIDIVGFISKNKKSIGFSLFIYFIRKKSEKILRYEQQLYNQKIQ